MTKPRAILQLEGGRTAAFWLPTDSEPGADDHLLRPGCGKRPAVTDPRLAGLTELERTMVCTRQEGHEPRHEAIGTRNQVLLRW